MINLDKIVAKQWNCEDLNNLQLEITLNPTLDMVKVAMMEFGKQLLELAAENAKLKCQLEPHPKGYPFAMYNPNGIIKNNDVYIVANKQSILDIIKEVEQ